MGGWKAYSFHDLSIQLTMGGIWDLQISGYNGESINELQRKCGFTSRMFVLDS